jgi:hypothetical protein
MTENVIIGELVQQDIRARMAKGRETYGRDLTPFNGRSALQDAYEEALDLAMYLKQLLIEDEALRMREVSRPDEDRAGRTPRYLQADLRYL